MSRALHNRYARCKTRIVVVTKIRNSEFALDELFFLVYHLSAIY